MARTFRKLPSVSDVQAGSTFSLALPIGLTYDIVYLDYSGVTLAQLKNLRFEVNGKPIIEFKDGQRLQDLNKHYGRKIVAGRLAFHFKRDEMKTLAEARAFGLGTRGLSTVTLKGDIDGAAASPALEAYAIQSNPAPIGMITKVKTFYKSAAAGLNEIDNLPRPQGARIAAIHLFSPTADISDIELEMDGVKIFDLSTARAAQIQSDNNRQPVTAKATAMDFVLEGDMAQAIPLGGVQDFRIRFNKATAESVEVVVEYFDQLPGI